jgi:hypothetical protein
MLRKKLSCKSETTFIMLNCIIQRQGEMIKGKKKCDKNHNCSRKRVTVLILTNFNICPNFNFVADPGENWIFS